MSEGFVWNPKERVRDGGGENRVRQCDMKKVVLQVPKAVGECWVRERKRKWFLVHFGKPDFSGQ